MRVIFLWICDFEWKIFLDFRCYKFAKVLMLLELIMGDMGRSKRMMKQLSTSFCTSCWIIFTAKRTEFHLFLIIPLLRFSKSSEVGKIADCIWSNNLPQVLELYRDLHRIAKPLTTRGLFLKSQWFLMTRLPTHEWWWSFPMIKWSWGTYPCCDAALPYYEGGRDCQPFKVG